MKIFAIRNEAGEPIQFFDPRAITDIDRVLPAEAVPISEEDWERFLAEPGRWLIDEAGKRVPAPAPVDPGPPVPQTITVAQLLMATRRVPRATPENPDRRLRADVDALLAACEAGTAEGLTAEQQGDLLDIVKAGTGVKRRSALVDVLMALFGMTPSDVDDLFRLGGTMGE